MPAYKTTRFRFLTVIIIAAGIFAANSCAPKPAQQEYITIGALLPLTGEDSDEGFRALNGLYLAKKEINENGGILGKKLDVIILNDRGDEEYIVYQYNALKEKGVTAIIGSSYSGVTIALAKAAEKDGIPVISPTASNPDVTKGRKNVFRAIFIDDYQAEVMAYFARNSLNAQTAVVFTNKTNDGFDRLVEIFTQSFKERGGRITAAESYSTWNDFAGIMRKYAANPPDVIFCPEDYVPAAKLVNAAYEAGLVNTRILGSDAWDGLLAYVYHPDAMKNVYYSAPFSFDDQDPNVVQFVRKYFDAFSQMPLSGSASAYTCVYILSEAIKKAGNIGKNAVISAIKENELDSIIGRIRFDENNNPHTNVYVIQIKDGEYSTYQKLRL
ncbi:MAG: ABC transporter substrate-binding protein [Treponema sp.]|jgi:branched-chain amino acid transport system substrate-binding protein|nr:ABC transporter substrate-binding protein [Treponema sp.]